MKLSVVLLAAALTAVFTGAATASTLTEASLGDFSGQFRTPSVVGQGATMVKGVLSSGGDLDLLAFTSLKPGAQTVSLTFSPPSPIGDRDWSFSAGGTVLYKTTPFDYSAWEGNLVASVGIQYQNRTNSFEYLITLGQEFEGSLYLALLGTYGTLKYNISIPGNAAKVPAVTEPVLGGSEPVVLPPVAGVSPPVSAVPLPAGAPLLLAALGALALLRRRRA